MKKIAVIISLCLVLSFPSLAISENWTGNINLLLGTKMLDEDDWEPVDEHSEFGISFDFKQKHWPVSIAFAYLSSEDDASATLYDPFFGFVTADVEGETQEVSFGVKKIWDATEIVKPFVGGGLAFINAEFSGTMFNVTMSEDDDAVGVWLVGGVIFTLAKHLNLGVQARYSYAEVELFGVDGDAGGLHGLFMVGYHW
jgi:opacity protein-like surface antigen